MERDISSGTILLIPLVRSGPEPHAALALNAPNAEGNFQVVGCSTKTYEPDHLIELPSDAVRPGGHPRTKLKKRTFAVCDWIENVSVSHVQAVKGVVPSTVYERILDKIRECLDDNTKSS